jgi:hypothetical protein
VCNWNGAKARPERNEAWAGLRRSGAGRLRTGIPCRPNHRGERRVQNDERTGAIKLLSSTRANW